MRVARKGKNFRFSESELAQLDQLVEYYEQNAEHFMFWRKVTRTDVIKMLVRQRLVEVEEIERKKIEAQIEAKPAAKTKTKSAKKAVKK